MQVVGKPASCAASGRANKPQIRQRFVQRMRLGSILKDTEDSPKLKGGLGSYCLAPSLCIAQRFVILGLGIERLRLTVEATVDRTKNTDVS